MRYKFSEMDIQAITMYFNEETHGEYIGVEQDGIMKRVPTSLIKSYIEQFAISATTDLRLLKADKTYVDERTAIYSTTDFIATENQTVFNVEYTVGYVDVFRDGVKLATSDFVATNGTTITLNSGCNSSDIICIKSLQSTFLIADTYTQGQVDNFNLTQDIRLDNLEGVFNINSWADVQKIVRAGLANQYFNIGDQLVANYKDEPLIWEVIGIDHDVPTDTNYTHSMTLQTKECIMNARIDAPQAIYGSETGLTAGTHIFTLNGIQYQVTTTVDIPPYGVLYGASWSDTYVPSLITMYDQDRITVLESGLVVTTTTGTDTITVNDHMRCRYGSNRYIDSANKQWQNSYDDVFIWQRKGLYDMPSSYETEGFLKLLDTDLYDVIGSVDKQVAQATVDGGGQDLFSDKIFLLSRVELGNGTEGTTTGESVYEFYDGISDTERIKLLNDVARKWYLRSPHVTNYSYARAVGVNGEFYYSFVFYSNGIAPVCVII